jgi:hypothetical protein
MSDPTGERLARIEEKLDTLIGEDGRISKIERTLKLHDKIIWTVSGAAAVIGFILRGLLGK